MSSPFPWPDDEKEGEEMNNNNKNDNNDTSSSSGVVITKQSHIPMPEWWMESALKEEYDDDDDEHGKKKNKKEEEEEEELEETTKEGSSNFLSVLSAREKGEKGEEEDEKDEGDGDDNEDAPFDFTKDPIEEMTYGRRFAMWMYPDKFAEEEAKNNSPSLAKAWGFFEHVTLERHLVGLTTCPPGEDEEEDGEDGEDDKDDDVDNDNKGNNATTTRDRRYSAIYRQVFGCTCLPYTTIHLKKLIPKRIRLWWLKHGPVEKNFYIAEPGERYQKTLLYPVFGTPLSQLGDYGMGVGIYFTTLLNLAFVLLLVGFWSIDLMVYYASDDYDSSSRDGVRLLLRFGSAICTDREWVPCPNCTKADFEQDQRGTYQLTRFYTHYQPILEPGPGYLLNVTDFLNWTSGIPPPQKKPTPINDLRHASIPQKYGNITLSASEGFLYNGTNVTAELGYTPIYCGHLGPADCYLELDNPNWDHNLRHHHQQHQEVPLGDTYVNKIPLNFAQKTNCNGADNPRAGTSQATLFGYILWYALSMYYRTKKAEKKFDEDEQTAQDYSIVVRNPPRDALDPQEWKEFFEQAMEQDVDIVMRKNNRVTVCTVNINNDEVITRHLVKRREILKQLELTLPPKTPLDDIEMLSKLCEDSDNQKELTKLVEELKTVEGKIQDFLNTAEPPAATRIYLTFETESAQRHVLSKMCVGRNHQERIPSHYLFRGKHKLSVREPEEPTTIRWQEQNSTEMDILIRKTITSLVTFGCITGAYLIIRELYRVNNPAGASFVTTIFTSLFPIVADVLVGLERHRSETSRQKWLFFKVVTFEVLITTVLQALTFPFQGTLDKDENDATGLIPYIHSLFISQIVMTPVIQYLDIGGNFQRHIMAPRAKTQTEMDMCMTGTPMDLAVLYSNMIKFFVMSLWYSAIYPLGWFMGSLALFVAYFADRFSLMRSWARLPQVGSEIADITWKWILPLAIAAMATMSGYYWSGFPYDNLCLDDTITSLPSYYTGRFNIRENAENHTFYGLTSWTGQNINTEAVVSSQSQAYKYCNQDLRFSAFPPLPSKQPAGGEWMSPEQADLCRWFPWYVFSILILVLFYLIGSMAYKAYQKFEGTYESRGDDQHINYSDVPVIDSYIPQVKSPRFLFPLILCDVQGVDRHLFKWEDEDHRHSYYDVTKDVAKILGKSDYPRVFTQVKHWKPEPTKASTEKTKDVPNYKEYNASCNHSMTTPNIGSPRLTNLQIAEDENQATARLHRYFCLFDGRTTMEPKHFQRIQEAVIQLFDESVVEKQMDMAEELVSRKACINVLQLNKCASNGRQVFYHLILSVPTEGGTTNKEQPPLLRQHIRGLATLGANDKITAVETKVQVISQEDEYSISV